MEVKRISKRSKSEENGVLPIKEQIKLILEDEAHGKPCDDCKIEELNFDLPGWFDPIKYARGQKYIQAHLFSQFTLTFAGLVSALVSPSFLTIIMKSHRSSTALGAYRRYLSTSLHLNTWYYQELKPGTIAWKSLTAVRERHLKTSIISKKRGDGHISQRDLVFGQFGFVGIGLLRPTFLSMDCSNRKDLEGYVHFWRVIGYMLGIEDKYNLCRPSLDETIEVANVILSEVYQPLLQNPPEYFYSMVEIFFKGMQYLNPNLSENGYMYYTYRLMGIDGFHYTEQEKIEAIKLSNDAERRRKTYCITDSYRKLEYLGKDQSKLESGEKFYKKLGWYDRTFLWVLIFMVEYVGSTFLGRLYFNYSLRFSLFMAEYFPYKLFWRFGIKLSYVNIFEEDIRKIGHVKTNQEMLACKKY